MFVRNVRSSCFREIFSMLSCGCCSAALLTRMSSVLNSDTVSLTACRQNFSSPTSPAMRMHCRPCSSTRRCVSFASLCSSRYTTATSAPSVAKAIATARPIPLSPPVMSATLFCSFPLPGVFRLPLWGAASFYARGRAIDLDVEAAGASFLWPCEKNSHLARCPDVLIGCFRPKLFPHRNIGFRKKVGKNCSRLVDLCHWYGIFSIPLEAGLL